MKRRGFTLIELMVVIAIIIILAAIAIPNYLKMTERAKRSRLSSDYATLATVLETFKTDWGKYPIGSAMEVNAVGSVVYGELSGTGNASQNVADNTNAVGETGPIEYLKPGTMTSMVNPFNTDNAIFYTSDAAGATWVVYTDIGTNLYYYRTDGKSTVSTLGSVPTPSD